MYPENIYERTMSKDNCKQISMEQFKSVLTDVKQHRLTNIEVFVLEQSFVKGRTASEIRYDLGYNGTSKIYHTISKIISILIENINFRYCDKCDKLSMFIGASVIKTAHVKDCTIREALAMYSSGHSYNNYYDELIAYTLLKRFNYDVDLITMYSLKKKEPKIMLYNIIYGSQSPVMYEKYLPYLFIKNINTVISIIFSYKTSFIHNIDSLLVVYNMKKDKIKEPVLDRLYTEHFTKLICDPSCLYTREYFDHKNAKEIDLSYISITISPRLYDICKNLVKGRDETLFQLIYAVLSLDDSSDKTISDDKRDMVGLLNHICSVNPTIKETVEDVQNFISETKKCINILSK